MKKWILLSLALCLFLSASLTNSWAAFRQDLPTLSLKDAIPAAEEALQIAGMDAASYVLFNAEFTVSRDGDYWFLNFQPRDPGNQEVFVIVYMNGKAEISGGTNARYGR